MWIGGRHDSRRGLRGDEGVNTYICTRGAFRSENWQEGVG